jgi:hypothetical protein
VEGTPPFDHLEEQGPERMDVGVGIGGLTARLLGRHVLRRAEDRPVLGEQRGRGVGVSGGRLPFVARELRQPEVQELHVAIVGDEDVLRLEVAMDDPGCVSLCERACYVEGDADRLGLGQGTARC